MYLQFGVALLDGSIRDALDHFAELYSLLVEDLFGFRLGSECLFDFALTATPNLLELVDELPFLFAAVGDALGVALLHSRVGPVGWTGKIVRFHDCICCESVDSG